MGKNKRIRMISAYEKGVVGGIKQSKPLSPKVRRSLQNRSSVSKSFRRDAKSNSQKN
jgi:hypothetical protein